MTWLRSVLPALLTLVLAVPAVNADPGKFTLGANSGDAGGVFALNTSSGRAVFFNSDGKITGKAMVAATTSVRRDGVFDLAVNSGFKGGCYVLDSRRGLAKYFQVKDENAKASIEFGKGAESDEPGSFTFDTNSGKAGGIFIFDARIGMGRFFNSAGEKVGEDMYFEANKLKLDEGHRAFAIAANSGPAGGVFVLNSRTGLCRFLKVSGKKFGSDMNFAKENVKDEPGRFALSVNSGKAGGAFILDTKTGVCRYFQVTGEQVGKTMSYQGEESKEGKIGTYTLSANSGSAGGVFIADTTTGVAKYMKISGEQIGEDMKYNIKADAQKVGSFTIAANSGSWGGLFIQDTEKGAIKYLKITGKSPLPTITE